jgi:hypothetical protein
MKVLKILSFVISYEHFESKCELFFVARLVYMHSIFMNVLG